MPKKQFLLMTVITAIILICIIGFYFISRSSPDLPTYFSYSENEKKTLIDSSSKQEIMIDALKKWDTIMFNLVKDNKLGDARASRVYAYLYTAQRDAAFLSMNIKKRFMGNIDLVSAQTLCLFFENDCADLKAQTVKFTDPYSQALANIVLVKIQARIKADEKNIHDYPLLTPAEQHWKGIPPYYGIEVGSWMPWRIDSVNKFVAPAPPSYNSSEWQHQLQLTKDALMHITPEQTKLVVFWAGNPGTVTPPGLWLIAANNYIFLHKIPMQKVLLVRSILTMSMADAVIAVFNSKYLYQVKRPFMLDPTILTIMPTPNHPSYPAGHSTISAAAATVLSYYFPDQSRYWLQTADEASMGRIWGGIHFTIDAQQGMILGKKVSEAVIAKEKN